MNLYATQQVMWECLSCSHCRSNALHQGPFGILTCALAGVPAYEMSQTSEIDVSDSALASQAQQFTQVSVDAVKMATQSTPPSRTQEIV